MKYDMIPLITGLWLLFCPCLARAGVEVHCAGTIAAWEGDRSMQDYMTKYSCTCANGNNSQPVCTLRSSGSAGSSRGSSGSKGNATNQAILDGMKSFSDGMFKTNPKATEERRQASIKNAQDLNEAQESALQSEEARRQQSAQQEAANRDKSVRELKNELQGLPGGDTQGSHGAADQLLSIATHSGSARKASTPEAGKGEATKGFDSPGQYAGSLKPTRSPWNGGAIPKEKQTPEIKKLLEERKELKEKEKDLEKNLATLENKKEKTPEDNAEISKLKEDLTTTKNKENFNTFTVDEELQKPVASESSSKGSR